MPRLVIWPKLASPSVVPGSPYCGWFHTLNISARNSSFAFSAAFQPEWRPNHGNSVTLKMDKSQLLIPDPRTGFLPPLPKVPEAGSAKALVLNHSFRLRLDLSKTGLPMISGRSQTPESPKPAWSFWRQMFTGRPERKVEMPLICHPEAKTLTMPVDLRAKGSSHT